MASEIRIGDIFVGNFPVTQNFGENPTMYAGFGLNGHNGTDFGTPIGTQLVACMAGTILETGDQGASGYGKYVKIINYDMQVCVLYGHLSEVLVAEGDQVWFGRLIGLSGNTGYSTGPHLHFGIVQTDADGYRINKDNGYQGWIDPSPFFKEVIDIQAPLPQPEAPVITPVNPPEPEPVEPPATTPEDPVTDTKEKEMEYAISQLEKLIKAIKEMFCILFRKNKN